MLFCILGVFQCLFLYLFTFLFTNVFHHSICGTFLVVGATVGLYASIAFTFYIIFHNFKACLALHCWTLAARQVRL